jgi:hypothetical protein
MGQEQDLIVTLTPQTHPVVAGPTFFEVCKLSSTLFHRGGDMTTKSVDLILGSRGRFMLDELLGQADQVWQAGFKIIDWEWGHFTISLLLMVFHGGLKHRSGAL